MTFGIGLGLGLTAYGRGSSAPSPDAAILALFAGGEPGGWYDPSDLSTMFQDRAGTTPVTAAGQTVGRILDKSGRGNHATAVSDAARGLYQVDAGLHYVNFDGVDDHYQTSFAPETDKFQIFAGLYTEEDTGSNQRVFNSGAFTANDIWVNTNAGGVAGVNSLGLDMNIPRVAFKTRYVLAGTLDKSQARAFISVKPGTFAQTVVSPIAGNYLTGGFSVGSRGAGEYMRGRVYGMIVRFGPNMTTAEIEAVEAWTAAKTGVTL